MQGIDDESKHSGRARVIIDSPMQNEMLQVSAKNYGGRANSAEINENEDYYNEEDEEEETTTAHQNVERQSRFQNSMPLSRHLLNWVASNEVKSGVSGSQNGASKGVMTNSSPNSFHNNLNRMTMPSPAMNRLTSLNDMPSPL